MTEAMVSDICFTAFMCVLTVCCLAFLTAWVSR